MKRAFEYFVNCWKTCTNMKHLFLILLACLVLIGCNDIDLNKGNKIISFNLGNNPKITTVKLSDLGFEDIEYIPLETNDQSLISNIRKIRVGNDFFLLQYFTRLLTFKKDGSFLAKIGIEGRGPEEFLVAHDVDIEKESQNIYLVSAWERKFNVYTSSGIFLRTFKSPEDITSFIITESGILGYSINTWGKIKNSFNLIDTNGNVIKKFPNKYPWNLTQPGIYVFEHENIFYRYNGNILKKEVYSDTVFLWKDLSFKPYNIILSSKNRSISSKERSKLDHDEIFYNYITPRSLFEFGEFLYYEFIIGRDSYGFIGSKKSDFRVFIKPEEGIINDLDGGTNILPLTIKDDNTIIGWVEAWKLKNHVASEAFRKSNPLYPEKKKELETLANSLKETDNPVLVMVKLKQ